MLLLDEPFGALDAFTREDLWNTLRDLWAVRQFNVILVTHDLREAVYLADTVLVMSRSPGRIVARRHIDLPRPRDLELTYTQRLRGHRARATGAHRRFAAAGGGADNETPVTGAAGALAVAAGRAGAVGGGLRGACRSANSSSRGHRASLRSWSSSTPRLPLHAWRTFWVTMLGFALAIVVGGLLGALIGSSRAAYAAIYPLLAAFNALPKAAFVPILVVWFGIGAGPAVLTAFLISFFPITVNIATGLATLGARAGRRAAGAGRHPPRRAGEGGPAALAAAFLWRRSR